ncbi:MAG: hypothetical protein PHY16_07135 [Methylobacter sp.]|nr:hypothetical protein [Methylobacter sp.]
MTAIRQNRNTRPRGFMTWNPRPDTQELLSQIKGILDEYSNYLPMTIRQIFYRLVGAHGYAKDEKAYSRLCECLNKARRAGVIPFAHIRDDGFSELQENYFSSPQSFIKTVRHAAENYQRDPQTVQPVRLFVWCEAAGMANQLAQVSQPYGVPVLSSGGFDSVTVKYDLARKFSEYEAVQVFHVGDHDPSGIHIFSSLEEDVKAFMVESETDIEFTRLAVTPAHIEQYSLPTAPAKATDNRRFIGQTVQCEALPPDILCGILDEALKECIDQAARNELIVKETAEHQRLMQWRTSSFQAQS